MVISPEFRMGHYRVNDHPYRAPQFIPIWGGLQNDTKIRTQLTGIDDIIIMTNEIITF